MLLDGTYTANNRSRSPPPTFWRIKCLTFLQIFLLNIHCPNIWSWSDPSISAPAAVYVLIFMQNGRNLKSEQYTVLVKLSIIGGQWVGETIERKFQIVLSGAKCEFCERNLS